MVMCCACFGHRLSLYLSYLCRAPVIAAVGPIFIVFSYDALSGRDLNLSPSRQEAYAIRVTPQSRIKVDDTPLLMDIFVVVQLS